MELLSFQAGPRGAHPFIKRLFSSEHLKKGPKTALIVNAVKRLTVTLPKDLYEEMRRISGGRVSAWLRDLAAKAVEEENLKLFLHTLPEELRARLLEKTGGNEREAANLALHYLSLAIEEEETEEAAQEAIAYANRQEAAREKKGKERSTG
jgi:hypothetical protein